MEQDLNRYHVGVEALRRLSVAFPHSFRFSESPTSCTVCQTLVSPKTKQERERCLEFRHCNSFDSLEPFQESDVTTVFSGVNFKRISRPHVQQYFQFLDSLPAGSQLWDVNSVSTLTSLRYPKQFDVIEDVGFVTVLEPCKLNVKSNVPTQSPISETPLVAVCQRGSWTLRRLATHCKTRQCPVGTGFRRAPLVLIRPVLRLMALARHAVSRLNPLSHLQTWSSWRKASSGFSQRADCS